MSDNPVGDESNDRDEMHRTQVKVAWIGAAAVPMAAIVSGLLTGGFGLLSEDRVAISLRDGAHQD